MLRLVLGWLVGWIHHLLGLATWFLAEHRRVSHLTVALTDPSQAVSLPLLERTLQLLQTYQPSAVESIKRHFRGVIIMSGAPHERGHWVRRSRICVLRQAHLSGPRADPDQLILTLAHEAMHARLHGAGVEQTRHHHRNSELLCSMAELQLARQVMSLRRFEPALNRTIDCWSTISGARAADSTYLDRELLHLRQLPLPKWAIAFVNAMRRH